MNIRKIQKRTFYNAEKRNKADNYAYLNENFCKKGQTVLVGDSITEMYNHTELFEEYTQKTGTSVYNRGISGDTSDRLLERFESNVLNIEPKNIVMLIGTNDLGVGSGSDFPAENIEKIITMIQNSKCCANIILLAVYPINSKMQKNTRRKNKDIYELNLKLGRLCKRKNVDFIDLTQYLSDEKGELDTKYTYDGLHLNAKAFNIVTNKILPYLI